MHDGVSSHHPKSSPWARFWRVILLCTYVVTDIGRVSDQVEMYMIYEKSRTDLCPKMPQNIWKTSAKFVETSIKDISTSTLTIFRQSKLLKKLCKTM